jgi:hypothetical protein
MAGRPSTGQRYHWPIMYTDMDYVTNTAEGIKSDPILVPPQKTLCFSAQKQSKLIQGEMKLAIERSVICCNCPERRIFSLLHFCSLWPDDSTYQEHTSQHTDWLVH